MKIIVSPTKQMIKKTNKNASSIPVFLKQTYRIQEQLELMSIEDIHDCYKISFALANDVYYNIHHKDIVSDALHFYTGTVFKQLQLETYGEDEYKYINDSLCILSSYYGLLHPSDCVSPYRLDMLTKFPFNLYHYWQPYINNYFDDVPCVLSLASKEYASMLQHPNIIEVDFVVKNGPTMTRNAMHVKKARGAMLHVCIKENITNIEQLKKQVVDGYCFEESLSSNKKLVFVYDKRKLD